MDAVLYLKERNRILKTYCLPELTQANCDACPFDDEGSCRARYPDSTLSIEEKVAIVEKWSKENPVKTNRQVYMETFGTDPRTPGFGIRCCPAVLVNRPCPGIECASCLKWWDEEYIEPKE